MDDRKSSLRTLVLTVSAALFVVLLIATVAYFASKEQNATKIVLPQGSAGAVEDRDTSQAEAGFVAVTKEIATTLVASLYRPRTYHQTLTRKTVYGKNKASATVQIWCRDGLTKLIVSESGEVRHILTNGSAAYVWYADQPSAVRFSPLPEKVTADDLSGVLTYESILALPSGAVKDAGYLQLSDFGDIPCLYVAAEEEADSSLHFWIDLSSGLLCKAEHLRKGEVEYELRQTRLFLLDDDDADLCEQLLLPDGKEPSFSAAE
jgi:hypothetical protein